MKLFSKLVIAVAVLGSSAAATAQLSAQADSERRARNRTEAMANWERTRGADSTRATRDMGSRASNGDPTRRDARQDARTVKAKTRKAANATRSFTHRQAEKLRNFGERQNRKYDGRTNTRTSNKSDTALGK